MAPRYPTLRSGMKGPGRKQLMRQTVEVDSIQ